VSPGLIAASGWGSGVNLYLVAALLGLLGRAGWMEVPDLLMRPEVIGGTAALYLVEFLADKMPYLDNLWDALHTALRPLGAAALGVLLSGDQTALVQGGAGVGSGALALASHSRKASLRGAVNTSPEPASNIVTSLAEDGLVAAVIALAAANPWIALIVVGLLTVASLVLFFFLARAAKRGIGRARQRLRERRERRRAPSQVGRPAETTVFDRRPT
jgi:hypothetical protein